MKKTILDLSLLFANQKKIERKAFDKLKRSDPNSLEK